VVLPHPQKKCESPSRHGLYFYFLGIAMTHRPRRVIEHECCLLQLHVLRRPTTAQWVQAVSYSRTHPSLAKA
jgi:hypothetical protein